MTTIKPWTEEDERQLLALKARGKPVAVIAKELDRTQEAVNTRLWVLKHRSQDGENSN